MLTSTTTERTVLIFLGMAERGPIIIAKRCHAKEVTVDTQRTAKEGSGWLDWLKYTLGESFQATG